MNQDVPQNILSLFIDRMMPYGCLATGYNVGMIEVVRDSKTVMKILEQNIRGAMQVSSKELHRWIKDKNKGDK